MTELLVGLVLALLVGAAIFMFLRGNLHQVKVASEQSNLLRDSNRAMEALKADISLAGFDPREPPNLPAIALAFVDPPPSSNPYPTDWKPTKQILTLQSLDIPVTGSIPSPIPTIQVTYEYRSTTRTLTRNDNPFLTDLDSFSFTYKSASNVAQFNVGGADAGKLSDPESVDQIHVQWVSRSANGTRKPVGFDISLRNFHGPIEPCPSPTPNMSCDTYIPPICKKWNCPTSEEFCDRCPWIQSYAHSPMRWRCMPTGGNTYLNGRFWGWSEYLPPPGAHCWTEYHPERGSTSFRCWNLVDHDTVDPSGEDCPASLGLRGYQCTNTGASFPDICPPTTAKDCTIGYDRWARCRCTGE